MSVGLVQTYRAFAYNNAWANHRLLGACESLACEMRLQRLVAGVNTARDDAYARLRRHGYRTEIQGVAMQRPNEPAFNRPEALVIDDWR